ncbi:MAG: hypothetical protein CSB48_01835 [Proteobacteria bacterium]|nr:MAG: hypothetical protein CSB48_01835 [Pseudomonadota bacterium]
MKRIALLLFHLIASPSLLLANECGSESEIILAPDFKISYYNYCTDKGDLSSLLSYYQNKCDKSEILLSEFRTRQAIGDEAAEKFLDDHRYAADYFCNQTEERIKTGVRRRQICSEFMSSGRNCGSPAHDSRLVINSQPSADQDDKKADPYEQCVTHNADIQKGALIVNAHNHCATGLFITVCLNVQSDEKAGIPARLDKAVGSLSTQQFVFPGVNQSAYKYLIGWCHSDTNDCDITCQ